jgi:protein TonB
MIMQEDFLNSERWLSLVFEGRNKEFGAYVSREESSDRHLKAMFIITVIALGLIFLPKVIKSMLPDHTDGIEQKGELKFTVFEQEPEQNQIKQIEVPPPLKLKASIIFTPPVIAKEVNNDEVAKTQIELTQTPAVISTVTIDGTQEGVDIATVKGNDEILGAATSENKPYVYVEVMPQFPGGEAALMKWLQDNMTYPAAAQEQNIQGRVSLRFVVKPDGSIDNVQIVKGLDPSCDKEALRVIKKRPKWLPGKQNGNSVSVYYSLPIVFKLNNQ